MSYFTFVDSPYAHEVLQRFRSHISAAHNVAMVIKVGGGIIDDEELFEDCLKAVGRLTSVDLYPIIIHGGGPQISATLESIGEHALFRDGLRVTSERAIGVVSETLTHINSMIVQRLGSIGMEAMGLTQAFTADHLNKSEYGEVGHVTGLNEEPIRQAIRDQVIPVVSCLAHDTHQRPLNVNGDDAAAKLVETVHPLEYISLTSTGGVIGADGGIIRHITPPLANQMYEAEQLTGGMYKKVQEALALIDSGIVEKILIVHPRHLITELFTDHGQGTLISH